MAEQVAVEPRLLACPLQACALCQWNLAYEDHRDYTKVLEMYNEKVDLLSNSQQLSPDQKCLQSILLNQHLITVERLMFDKGDIQEGALLGKMTTLRTTARAHGPWGMVNTTTPGVSLAAAAASTAAAAADTTAAGDDDAENGGVKKKTPKTKASQAKRDSNPTAQQSGTRITKIVQSVSSGTETRPTRCTSTPTKAASSHTRFRCSTS
jgi:hypothetical protein